MPAKKRRYELILDGPEGKTSLGYPDSVTEILKRVFDDSFGPAAWWGFKCGAAALSMPTESRVTRRDLESAKVVEMYEAMKLTKITPNTVRDDAGDRGKKAHKVAQQIGNGEITADEALAIWTGLDEDSGYCRAAAQWHKDHENDEFEDVGSEIQVYNPALNYVGTFDRLRRFKGQYSDEQGTEEIIDWKTTKPPIRFTQHLQLGAYDLALPGHAGPRLQRVVLFASDGTYIESTAWVDPQVFVGVKALYDEIKRWEAENA